MNQEAIDAYNAHIKEEAEKKQAQVLDVTLSKGIKKQVDKSAQETQKALTTSIGVLIRFLNEKGLNVEVTNQKDFPTSIATPDVGAVAKAIKTLADNVDKLPKKFPDFPDFPKYPDFPKTLKIDNLSEIKPWLEAYAQSINNIKFDPVIRVAPTPVTVTESKVDTKAIADGLGDVKKAVDKIKLPETNFNKLEEEVRKTTKAINSLSFPVPNYVLPFKNTEGAATQVQLDSSGNLPTAAGSTAYQLNYDTTSTVNAVYLGKSVPGSAGSAAAWQIVKINTTTQEKRYADDVATFTKQWSARTGYTY